MSGIARTLLCADSGSCSRTVVTVSHIESIDLVREDIGNLLYRSVVVDHPERMPEAVLVCKRILRSSGHCPGDDLIQLRVILIGEKYRFDVGILDFHVDHTVIFLVLAGKLVLLDLALSIVVGMGAEHQSVLSASFHSLGIDIVARLLVLHQPAVLLPLGEILHGPVIDLVVMVRQNRLAIYLRLGDVEQ